MGKDLYKNCCSLKYFFPLYWSLKVHFTCCSYKLWCDKRCRKWWKEWLQWCNFSDSFWNTQSRMSQTTGCIFVWTKCLQLCLNLFIPLEIWIPKPHMFEKLQNRTVNLSKTKSCLFSNLCTPEYRNKNLALPRKCWCFSSEYLTPYWFYEQFHHNLSTAGKTGCGNSRIVNILAGLDTELVAR